jgi:hypothetical protein
MDFQRGAKVMNLSIMKQLEKRYQKKKKPRESGAELFWLRSDSTSEGKSFTRWW